jgi:hypothetical protein
MYEPLYMYQAFDIYVDLKSKMTATMEDCLTLDPIEVTCR